MVGIMGGIGNSVGFTNQGVQDDTQVTVAVAVSGMGRVVSPRIRGTASHRKPIRFVV